MGKSTLLNALVEDERVVTGPEPGVTRDAIAVDWSYRGHPIRLVDTAGMRRRARITDRVEKLSTGDAINAIRLAQVVVLVLDGDAILDKQDLTIARHVIDEGRALVIAVNKWDLVGDHQAIAPADRPAADLAAAGARHSDGHHVGAQAPAARHAAGCGAVGLRDLECPDQHRPAEPLAGGRARSPSAAHGQGAPGAAALHDPGKGAAADLRPVGLAARRAGGLYIRYLANGLRDRFGLDGVPLGSCPARAYAESHAD